MSSAELQGQGRSRGMASTPRHSAAETAPDYHALGTFAETWMFLELFLERCAGLVGGVSGQDSLAAKLEALDAAARVAPMLKDFASEISVLTADIRTLAAMRQAVLQGLAQASLERLGMGLFAIPSTARASKAAPLGQQPSIDTLHLKTCDLVRRTLLLLNTLEAPIAE